MHDLTSVILDIANPRPGDVTPVSRPGAVTYVPAPSPLDEILRDAANKLASRKMTRLPVEPARADLKAILADLDFVARIFDTVIAEIGDYAGQRFGVSNKEIVECFHDQVSKALDGNATFVLQEAMREIEERG